MSCAARFVLRDRFSATDFWSDIRATRCVTAALVGPMTALLYSAPAKDDDASTPLRNAILGRKSTPEELQFLAEGGFAG